MEKPLFDYLKPADEQMETMHVVRSAAADYFKVLVDNIPDGADKTYLIRKLREVAMWANVAITRHADGTPRE